MGQARRPFTEARSRITTNSRGITVLALDRGMVGATRTTPASPSREDGEPVGEFDALFCTLRMVCSVDVGVVSSWLNIRFVNDFARSYLALNGR